MALLYYKNGSSWVNALNLFYPVGAVYLANTSTSPSSLFGGTWQRCTEGGMVGIYGAPNITTLGTGGSRIISVSNLPSHTHSLTVGWGGSGTNCIGLIGGTGDKWSSTSFTSYNGSSEPYIPGNRSFYLWYRTA